MTCIPLATPTSKAKASFHEVSSRSPLSPLLDVSCDWIMREAALELLQLPRLGHTPDNHLIKNARAAAASVTGNSQFMVGRAVERPNANLSSSSEKVRRSRKRPRRSRGSCTTPLASMVNNQYTMTLFDRSIDLAQHNEATSLYVMCRSWIGDIRPGCGANSNSYLEMPGVSPTVREGDDDDDDTDIWRLPTPTPETDYDDDGAFDNESDDEHSCTGSGSPGRDSCPSDCTAIDEQLANQSAPHVSLMTEHMASWKRTRKVKMSRMHANLRRHMKSMLVLRDLHERAANCSTTTLMSISTTTNSNA